MLSGLLKTEFDTNCANHVFHVVGSVYTFHLNLPFSEWYQSDKLDRQ